MEGHRRGEADVAEQSLNGDVALIVFLGTLRKRIARHHNPAALHINDRHQRARECEHRRRLIRRIRRRRDFQDIARTEIVHGDHTAEDAAMFFLARPRMRRLIGREQPRRIDGRIELRRRKRRVSEKFLDRAQIAAAAQQMRRK